MYQIIRRDGKTVDFDLHKISQAIMKACQAEREVDSEIDHVLALLCGGTDIDASYYQDVLLELKERQREIREYRKIMTQAIHAVLRSAWMRRNRSAGRSNTSAVSDMMLLTVPTPPTFVAANRSLQKWGMMYGAVA